MFSIRIVRCNSPRPETRKTSASSVSSTRSATLARSSRSRRSRIWRLVTYLPSWPASGDLFTMKFMVSVGSSTPTIGEALGLLRIGERGADDEVLDAGDRDDLARGGDVGLDLVEALEGVDHADLRLAHELVARHDRDLLRLADRAAADAADRRCGRGSSSSRRRRSAAAAAPSGSPLGSGTYLSTASKSGRMSVPTSSDLGRRPAVDGRGVDHRESRAGPRWRRACP